jgi:predicted nucleotidyltransferase
MVMPSFVPDRPSMSATFDGLLNALSEACQQHYRQRLVSLAVYGSVGRGTPRSTSDIDVMLVVDSLPDGRTARMQEFAEVDQTMAAPLAAARALGVETEVSPVFKTPAELAVGSPLLLDMTEDARILVDRGELAQALTTLRTRLAAQGARRVFRGNAWFWDLKPDYRPGDTFTL